MNVYKYWLLKHIDLIDDIKGIITNYAKVRIIRPPPVEVFKYDDNTYIHDNIIYDIGDFCMIDYVVYRNTHFHVVNNKIVRIQFNYCTSNEIYVIHVDFCNINIISLYKLYDMTVLSTNGIYLSCSNIKFDGIHATKDNIVFIVES